MGTNLLIDNDPNGEPIEGFDLWEIGIESPKNKGFFKS